MEEAIRRALWGGLFLTVTVVKTVFLIPRGVCRHRPTCMTYAKHAILNDPVPSAGISILRRFLTCNPLFAADRSGSHKSTSES